MSEKKYGGGSGPYDSSWDTDVNWTTDAEPIADDDVILDDTRVNDLNCDVITPLLKTFTQAAAYTGLFTVKAARYLFSKSIDISGQTYLEVGGSFVVAGAKLYLRSGSSISGGGTNSIINMYGDSQAEEVAGSVSNVEIYFYLNSATYPLKAKDYSSFLRAVFNHNGTGVRTIFFEGGTHEYPVSVFRVSVSGASYALRMGTNNPDVIFHGAVSTSIASGAAASISFGSGTITFKDNVDLSALFISGSGIMIFNGTTAQSVAFSNAYFGHTVRFQNAAGVTIPAGKNLWALTLYLDGPVTVTGDLKSAAAFQTTANCVMSGAGNIYIGTSEITALPGSSSFSGITYAEVLTTDGPTVVCLHALDYSSFFPTLRMEYYADDFEGVSLFEAGNYTFGNLIFFSAEEAKPVEHDWATNDPNVIINGDWTVATDGGAINFVFGGGRLTLKGAVDLSAAATIQISASSDMELHTVGEVNIGGATVGNVEVKPSADISFIGSLRTQNFICNGKMNIKSAGTHVVHNPSGDGELECTDGTATIYYYGRNSFVGTLTDVEFIELQNPPDPVPNVYPGLEVNTAIKVEV